MFKFILFLLIVLVIIFYIMIKKQQKQKEDIKIVTRVHGCLYFRFIPPEIKLENTYCEYFVKGKNPRTNRIKTLTVVAPYSASEEYIYQKSGLLEPYTISKISDSPSDKQVAYAKDLNIVIPKNCTRKDLSHLISRQLSDNDREREEDYVNNQLLEYAADNNICISSYASMNEAIRIIIHKLPPKECVIFWIYIVYCSRKERVVKNLYKLPVKDIFYNFVISIPDNIENLSELIKNSFPEKPLSNRLVDKKNKQLVCLYDSVCKYLEKCNAI